MAFVWIVVAVFAALLLLSLALKVEIGVDKNTTVALTAAPSVVPNGRPFPST